MGSLQGFIWCVEQNVSVYPHVELIPHRDLDRGLAVQIAASDLGADIGCLPAGGTGGDVAGARVGEYRAIARLRDVRGRGEQAGQYREADEAAVVAVHLLPESRETVRVLADHS